MMNALRLRTILVIALAPLALGTAHAQQPAKGGGKIVCWKDKSGKVVGCGDSVPPEYQSSATQEMDQRGITRKTTESVEDAQKRRAKEQELAAQKAAEERRVADQKRQDSALLNSYANTAEIDQRRDRDLQPINLQIAQFQGALKTAGAGDKAKLEHNLAAKEKEREEIVQRYAAQKKRYLELKGEAPGAQPASAAAPAPATAAAPAKK